MLAKIAAKFPSINFDFAHCFPIDEMAAVVSDLPNVWTDVAWLADDALARLGDYDWHGRLLFGSDFPAYHAKKSGSFTELYRKALNEFRVRVGESDAAFKRFLNRRASKGHCAWRLEG